MTVRELATRMDNGEYVRWQVWFARQAQREELERLKERRRR